MTLLVNEEIDSRIFNSDHDHPLKVLEGSALVHVNSYCPPKPDLLYSSRHSFLIGGFIISVFLH